MGTVLRNSNGAERPLALGIWYIFKIKITQVQVGALYHHRAKSFDTENLVQ